MKLIIEFESAEELSDFLQWKKLNDERKASRIGKTPIRETDWLEVRTENLLASAGIEFVEDALTMSDAMLLNIPNFGKAALRNLRENHNPN